MRGRHTARSWPIAAKASGIVTSRAVATASFDSSSSIDCDVATEYTAIPAAPQMTPTATSSATRRSRITRARETGAESIVASLPSASSEDQLCTCTIAYAERISISVESQIAPTNESYPLTPRRSKYARMIGVEDDVSVSMTVFTIDARKALTAASPTIQVTSHSH